MSQLLRFHGGISPTITLAQRPIKTRHLLFYLRRIAVHHLLLESNKGDSIHHSCQNENRDFVSGLFLSDLGHELRRPHADILRDGIYELRARSGNVNYRILYFYHGKNVAILAHGLTKEAKVPKQDIERVIERKATFEKDAERHSYKQERNDG